LNSDRPLTPGVRDAAVDRISFFLSLADDLEHFYRIGYGDVDFAPVLEALRSTPGEISHSFRVCLLGGALSALSRRGSAKDQTGHYRRIWHKPGGERSEVRRFSRTLPLGLRK